MCAELVVTGPGRLHGEDQARFRGQNSRAREFDVWSINDMLSNLGTSFVEVFLSKARCTRRFGGYVPYF